MDTRALGSAVTVVGVLVASSAFAQQRPNEDALAAQANQKVEAEVGATAPELLPKLREAEQATLKDDYPRAQKLYGELHDKLPAQTSLARRLCHTELRLGHRERALELCRVAARDETPDNIASLAEVLAQTPDGREEALRLVRHAAELEPASPWVRLQECAVEQRVGTLDAAVTCGERLGTVVPASWAGGLTANLVSRMLREHEPGRARRAVETALAELPGEAAVQGARASVAMEENDLASLGAATEALRKLAPKDPRTFVLTAIDQASRGKFSAAQDSLATAERLGAPHDEIARLSANFEDAKPWYLRWLVPAAWVFGAWVAGLAALYLGGLGLSAVALRAARTPPSTESGNVTGMSAALRGAYRALLWLCSAYYFISIPIVVALVLVIAALPILLMLWVGYVFPKLILIIGLVVLGTLGAFAKSAFAKRQDRDPGLRLELRRYPELSRLLDEVAGRLGTRGADAVFLTPDASVAVFERGGVLGQLRGRSERCLILGAAVLEDMPLDQLRAILAHEFGHFSNRDTAGGGLALAVRRSLLLTAVHLAHGGAATAVNPAWLFVNGYHKLFLRISHGASRLQEVLADRFAAFAYGSESFVAGLVHVIRRDVEFDHHANAAVNELVQTKSAFVNLYRHVPPAAPLGTTIEQSVKDAIERPGSPYDSHPTPRERIDYARQLAVVSPKASDADTLVWTLFPDRERLEQALTSDFLTRFSEATGIIIAGRGS